MTTSTIRGDRWFGFASGLEITREIRLNTAGTPFLLLRMRDQGQTDANGGFFFFSSGNTLSFRQPQSLTRLKVKFKIGQANVSSHCVENTFATSYVQPLVMTWTVFNDGSSSGPSDPTGDHYFNLTVSRFAN